VRLRVADGVGVESVDGVVYAAPLPDGPIMVLDGVAALIWDEADGVSRDAVADAVATFTAKDAASIRPHVEQFIDEMLKRWMLVED
jgi:hypothetical protein